MPPAVASLKAHINDDDPTAWRASLRVLELAFPRTAEPETPEMPLEVDDVLNLGWQELRVLAARMTIEQPSDGALELVSPVERSTEQAHGPADR